MKYWFQDLNLLINVDKLDEFLPKSYMSYPEKVNSLVRLSIYIGLLLSVINKNYLYLYIPIGTMLLTVVLYLLRQVNEESKREQKSIENLSQMGNEGTDINKIFSDNNSNNTKTEKFDNTKKCSKSTDENPFMNPMPFDNRKRAKACPLNKNTKMEIEKNFNQGLFRDVGDIFNKSSSQREFYTVPTTTYPSDQTDFANWLYKTPKTCKEGNGAQCVANTQERLNQQSYKFPNLY